jgi:hypothetical protein
VMYLSRTRNNSGGNGQGVPNTLSLDAKLARAGGGGGGGGGVGDMRVIRTKFVFGLSGFDYKVLNIAYSKTKRKLGFRF